MPVPEQEARLLARYRRRADRGTGMSRPIPAPKAWPDVDEVRTAHRLWAGLVLSPRLEVMEALLAGQPVPARRLDQAWVCSLSLAGDVVLDDALVLRINAHGPLLSDPLPVRESGSGRVLRLGDAGLKGRDD